MGSGIAHVSVVKGFSVVLKDTNETGLYKGVNQIQNGLETVVRRKRITKFVTNV